MSYRVRYTATAEQDLRSQFLWLQERSAHGADTWRHGIIKAVDSLQKHPESNALAPEGQRFGRAIRQLLYGKHPRGTYRILYVVEDQEVLILTIRHGMQQQLSKPDIDSLTK